MADDRVDKLDPELVQKLIERSGEAKPETGKPLSRWATQTQRSLESYLTAGVAPRWMQRLSDVDRGIAAEKRKLRRAYEELREATRGDSAEFARRWSERAETWRFPASLHELIRQHNEYYPIERRLAMDPRTGDYVKIAGRSYRRPVLDADWILAEFPPQGT